MKKEIWRVRIEDANENVIAHRDFDTYEEANEMLAQLLDFTWLGFMAAPGMSPHIIDA